MEKTISIRNTEITFSIWDLGGQREFVNMLPLVCNDAVAILFMFDLTRKSTLNSIKEWYRQGRGFNKTAIPFLVGTKYDHFVNFPREEQEEISLQAKRFAKAMKASLIFSSTSHSINVQKVSRINTTGLTEVWLTARRSSRLCFRKRSTCAAQFRRLSTLASRYCYISLSAEPCMVSVRTRLAVALDGSLSCMSQQVNRRRGRLTHVCCVTKTSRISDLAHSVFWGNIEPSDRTRWHGHCSQYISVLLY